MGATSLSPSSQTQPSAGLKIAVSGHASSPAGQLATAAKGRGHDATHCESAHALVKLMGREEFDVAVAFLDQGQEATALVRWFGGRRPSTTLILGCVAQSGIELAPLLKINPRVQLWESLPVAAQLEALQGISPRAGLVGRGLEIDIIDYIQITNLNGATKLIRVSSRNASGYIWFDRGSIVHAEYGNSDAESAFYSLVSAASGSFCEVAYQAPPRVSIGASNTHLLMEASRLMDEAKLPTTQAGFHALDTSLFHPMCQLEGDQAPNFRALKLEERNPLPIQLEDLDCADVIDSLFEVQFGVPAQSTREFVDFCMSYSGVIQTISILFDEKLPLQGPRDELHLWVESVLPVFRCRSAMPTSVVCERHGRSHFVAVVLEFYLVAVQLHADHDPQILKNVLLAKAEEQ